MALKESKNYRMSVDIKYGEHNFYFLLNAGEKVTSSSESLTYLLYFVVLLLFYFVLFYLNNQGNFFRKKDKTAQIS